MANNINLKKKTTKFYSEILLSSCVECQLSVESIPTFAHTLCYMLNKAYLFINKI